MARIIAAAQYAVVSDEFGANLDRHLLHSTAAANLGVNLLVFPEMSLTGYQVERAAELVVNPYASAFEPLKTLAREASMTILAGAPIRLASTSLHIAQLAFLPSGIVAIYTKRHLTEAESAYFTPGQGGPILRTGGLMVAMAVGADITQASHAANAAAHKANIYVASVLLRETAHADETALLQAYARTHKMAVLMANHAAPAGGLIPVGRSAIWDEQGALIASSPGTEESLVLARRRGKSWEGAVFPLKDAAKPAIPAFNTPSAGTIPITGQRHLFSTLDSPSADDLRD
jgi:predicted amidohydrolase